MALAPYLNYYLVNFEKDNIFKFIAKSLLDTFIDYLVCSNSTIDVEVIAQALLDRLIGESVDNTITEVMIGILKTYI